ncbi:PHB depolymerase family esterase [Bradyrhizobium sp. AUGA SZCCT0283]|jgi:poly(hydroxyalkanoate) depolymerase family esterase|uniref:extracellular catalytic domain type 1 short-chain-length polyhydroxyalkanoate depolymerase n=1 Tax=Bradyrhizobium sp. AUGA SZCCT0283 TaxID=2807671 RepID=UPI001BAC3203|nr:PHB depolymerase family esterase [Bradyrhizobium sp. AUGA SZCCT0283]MBR1279837.1 PHB depolymerase family esterase [Bradyrhizobium sp. AUGA SZCCT0283]
MLNQDIIREATRLTRAGQLVEATALLQRMLRGERAPDAPSRTSGRIGLPGPLIIDAKANAVEETDNPPQLEPATTAQPRLLRALPDRKGRRSGIGLRGVMKRAPLSTPDIVPEGARFIEGTYSSPAGSRAYRLFIPSRYRQQPLPLVVMLHGCTQSPDDFAAGTRMNFIAEERNCFVVYPAQPSRANQAKCWNWFRTADQQRGKGEPSLIAGITRQIMHDYSVDPKRVYVGGLSAGAAAAAIMGATYDDLYAAIGIHSGLACGAATDLPSALVAMRQGGSDPRAISGDRPTVPTIVFHGDRDTTVHPNNGGQILEQSLGTMSKQKKVHRGQVPGGHAYTRTILSDAGGRGMLEHWNIHGAGHAWSGGSPAGSYTDPRGPDATREMLRFFLEHSLPEP